MDRCTQCGADLSPNAQFCGRCGTNRASSPNQATQLSSKPSDITLLVEETLLQNTRQQGIADDRESTLINAKVSAQQKLGVRKDILPPILPPFSIPAGHVPMVSGTPQFASIPSVPGTPQIANVPNIPGTPAAQAGHAGNAAQAGHAGNAAQAGHAGNVAQAGHVGNAAQAGHVGNAAQAGHMSQVTHVQHLKHLGHLKHAKHVATKTVKVLAKKWVLTMIATTVVVGSVVGALALRHQPAGRITEFSMPKP
ncbi:MAG: zinc ribbon domain-containing protein, partial [Ktedonobacteraceae bacterium]